MDDDEEFETVYMEYEVPSSSRRFYKIDFVVMGLHLLDGVVHAISETCNQALQIAAGHANWQAEQDSFHEQAALEIESLIAGEDE